MRTRWYFADAVTCPKNAPKTAAPLVNPLTQIRWSIQRKRGRTGRRPTQVRLQTTGRRAVVAQDGVGFVVNRYVRAFFGEALKLVQEASPPSRRWIASAGSAAASAWARSS